MPLDSLGVVQPSARKTQRKTLGLTLQRVLKALAALFTGRRSKS